MATVARAQSALDPNCWIPTVGNGLDRYLKSLEDVPYYAAYLVQAPGPQNDPSQYFIAIPEDETAIGDFDVYSCGRPFRISELKYHSRLPLDLADMKYFLGHFHSTKVYDMLVMYDPMHWGGPVIYWADSLGEFDTSRYSRLASTVQGDYRPDVGAGFSCTAPPYIAHLTNDSLDDILFLGITVWSGAPGAADAYAILFRGGGYSFRSDTLHYCDSVQLWDRIYQPTGQNDVDRFSTIADFRGVGRKDWLAFNKEGDIFYFRNDPPFSMERFVEATKHDTVMAAWQNPLIAQQSSFAELSNVLTMRALPKSGGDSSYDFMPTFPTKNDFLTNSIWIFRGGPDFGTKRFAIDTGTSVSHDLQKAEFIIRAPAIYDSAFNGAWFRPDGAVGDLTGTGRPVLKCNAGYQTGYGWDLYYVLGDAIDEKADIEIEYDRGGADHPITVDADGDKYEDLLFHEYAGGTVTDSSGFWILHGSPKIPIHLNQSYAVRTEPMTVSDFTITPNPASSVITLHYTLSVPGRTKIELFDALGRTMMLQVELDNGLSQQVKALDVSSLPDGMYLCRISNSSTESAAKFTVQH